MAKRIGPEGALDEFGIPMGLRIDTGIWELPDREFFEGDGDWETVAEELWHLTEPAREPNNLKIVVISLGVLVEALLGYGWGTGTNWPLFTGAVLMLVAAVIGVKATMPGRQPESGEPG